MTKNCNIYLRPHSIQLEVRALLIDCMEVFGDCMKCFSYLIWQKRRSFQMLYFILGSIRE